MNRWDYLALALELWTAVGLLGLLVSLLRRERRKLLQGVLSLIGVWTVYLAALLIVSHRQPERLVPLGRPACFRDICFTAQPPEELDGFPARNRERLVRLVIQIRNRGDSPASDDPRPFLRDAQGRTWTASGGVSGNRLDARVLPASGVTSQPVFAVSPDATRLQLVLSHGRWSRHTLVIGDPESLGHRPQVLLLYP